MEEMMSIENLQLAKAQESGQKVRIYIVNGYQINAEIIDFDSDVILCSVEGRMKMIYRHAVSTIEL